MEPGDKGGDEDCVNEYAAPPGAVENENPAVEGVTAFAEVDVVTTK